MTHIAIFPPNVSLNTSTCDFSQFPFFVEFTQFEYPHTNADRRSRTKSQHRGAFVPFYHAHSGQAVCRNI
jgi:hypothetical protein